MSNMLKNFVRNEDGATMVEYGIMVALIAAVSITMISNVGQKVLTAFTGVNTALTPAT